MFKEYSKNEEEREEIVESIDESLIEEQSVTEDSLDEFDTKEPKVEVVKFGVVLGCFKLNVRKELYGI